MITLKDKSALQFEIEKKAELFKSEKVDHFSLIFHVNNFLSRCPASLASDAHFKQMLHEIGNSVRLQNATAQHAAVIQLVCVDWIELASENESKIRFIVSRYASQPNQNSAQADFHGLERQLSSSERERALDMLTSFSERSMFENVVPHATNVLADIQLESDGYLGAFRRDLQYVLSQLEVQNDEDTIKIAQGALQYLAKENDVIPDELGYIGLLDDMFVMRQAAYLLGSPFSAITNYLQTSSSRYPFLSKLYVQTVRNKRYDYLPDYTLSLIIPFLDSIRSEHKDGSNSSCFVTEQSNSFSILTSICATLSLLNDVQLVEAGLTDSEIPFRLGQKLLLDYKRVVEYGGIEAFPGRDLVKLSTQGASERIPVDELYRLHLAADDSEVARTRTRSNNDPNRSLLPIQEVFTNDRIPPFFLTKRKVFLVIQSNTWTDFFKDFRFMGGKVEHCIPIARYSNEEFSSLTPSMAPSAAKLILVPSLDDLTGLILDDHLQDNDILIVDGSQQSEPRLVNFLSDSNIPKISIAMYFENPNEYLGMLKSRGYKFWKWPDETIHELIVKGGADHWESRVLEKVNSDYSMIPVVSDAARKINRSWSKLSKRRNNNGIEEDEKNYLSGVYRLLLQGWALNSATVNGNDDVDAFFASFSSYVDEINTDSYIDIEMKELVRDLHREIDENLEEAIGDRTRAIENFLREQLDTEHYLAVHDSVERDLGSAHEVLLNDTLKIFKSLELLVIPWWPSRNKVQKILRRSGFMRTVFILFEHEQIFYNQFRRLSHLTLSERDFMKDFLKLSEGVEAPPEIESVAILEDIDRVEQQERTDRVFEIISEMPVREEQSQVMATRVFFFDDGSYCLSADRSSFNKLEKKDSNFVVVEVKGETMTVGDHLFFLHGGDSDAIRVKADERLGDTRMTAKAWQTQLKDYANRNGMSAERIKNVLEERKCHKTIQTIRNWLNDDDMIAPRSYQKIIPLLSELFDLPLELDSCLNAIRKVYEAHRDAGKRLSDEYQAVFVNRLEGGNRSEELGVENQKVNILTVESIEKIERLVPYNLLRTVAAGL